MKNIIKAVFLSLVSIFVLIAAETLGQILGSVFSKLLGVPDQFSPILITIFSILFAFLFAWLIFVKGFKYSLEDFRIRKSGFRWYWLLTGILLVVFVFGILMFFSGKLESCDGDRVSLILRGIFTAGILPGVIEELAFRGLFMGVLEKSFNKYVAIFVPSFVFGAIHIMNGPLNVSSTIQLLVGGTLVGVMFSIIDYESGSILNSMIVHTIWDAAQSFLMIDTATRDDALFTYVLQSKNPLITGGGFGIECSIVTIIGYIVIIAIALLLIRRNKARAKEA